MFDKKTYVKEKILKRLNTSVYYQQSKQKQQISDLIDSLKNLDMIAYSGSTFEESIIGWLSFCKTIDLMLENNQMITLDSFQDNILQSKSTGFKNSETITYDYTKIDEDKEIKLKRLNKIAEVADLTDDIEYDFLTDEGLKVIGVVDRNETYLDAKDINIKKDNFMPVVKVLYDDLINNGIISPFTNTTQVAQVSHDVWMDVDTEELFRVQVV